MLKFPSNLNFQAMDEYFLKHFGCVCPLQTNKPEELHCDFNHTHLGIYLNFLDSKVFDGYCQIPCTSMEINFHTSNIDSNKPKDEAIVKFYFKNFVKVNTSFWSYTMISLLGEVGGYVGLLLGVSLLDIATIIKKVMK